MKRNGNAVIYLVILVLCSCAKSNSGGNPSANSLDIYVAGTDLSGSHAIAKYWKNGTAVPLTDGTANAHALSIAVTGNDVYVAGYVTRGTSDLASYWKNGSLVVLGDTDSQASAITISGGDVYIAGFENDGTY